ncbi:MAG: AAC(3) family N-acetyltransferase [Pseudomonadota bacterium]
MQTTVAPIGMDELCLQLSALGLRRGDTVLVHASRGATLPVAGGHRAVLAALSLCVGPRGTVAMPAFSSAALMPTGTAALGAEALARVDMAVPGFCPDRSPADLSGPLAQTFLADEETRRSIHPVYSLAARGHRAAALTTHHPRDWPMGQDGPMGRLLEMPDAVMLRLGGASWPGCPVLVMAETMARHRRLSVVRFKDARRGRWVHFRDIAEDREAFYPALGAALEKDENYRPGIVAGHAAGICRIDDMVAFAAPRISAAVFSTAPARRPGTTANA